MPELILIVIIATFITGLFFCDREEKRSSLWDEMYPPVDYVYLTTSITRENFEKMYIGNWDQVELTNGSSEK